MSAGGEHMREAGAEVQLSLAGALCRRVAYAVLVVAVRGRRERGGPWGEAVLGEFAMTRGGREAVRWAIGGLRTAWQERRARWRYLPRFDTPARRAVGVAVLGLLAAVLVNQFVVSAQYIPSFSMAPTLLASDRILIDKVGFRLTGIHRDDVVFYTADNLEGRSVTFVKRVVGLPGDTVECRGGVVFRNGTALVERRQQPTDTPLDPVDCPRTVVPAGKLFVVGDDWEVSMDSRQVGPIPRDAVTGRMLVRIWPLKR